MEYTFYVPSRLNGDAEGFEILSSFAAFCYDKQYSDITIDFNPCTFIQGNLCAVLGAIIKDLQSKNNVVRIINVNDEILGLLKRNEFLYHYQYGEKIYDDRNTCIPYNIFTLNDEENATNFFLSQIFEKPKMPNMSPMAKKKIIRNIFEICVNAVTHSGCNIVHCCGQVFRTGLRKAIVTFVDTGKTIKQNVNAHLGSNKSGSECILWAMEDGNTTREGNTPGGLGLNEVYQLIDMNKGKLQIISADGYVEILGGKKNSYYIGSSFPGTIVNMEIKLNDDNFYFLDSEALEQTVIF
ncbi:hypothetical protein [Sphingobacterium sp.]|uniref:hypothetical protein n=1 Tax=Sphingobacterium sp. TaxID=341027 RepID=UPI0028995D36|nr:hypothetical protein [Sphingobacterium sp.]